MSARQLRILSIAQSSLRPGEIAAVPPPFKRGTMGTCDTCANAMPRRVERQRFCSDRCRQRSKWKPDVIKPCQVCGAAFERRGQADSNRRHCSEACARISAKKSRHAFHEKRPERDAQYRESQRRKRNKDTSLGRLWRKYPWLPHECEACGETRVLDIAHRPEHRRNGAWKTMANTTAEMVWILCPTHHALLDRLGYTAEQLGIRPRREAM